MNLGLIRPVYKQEECIEEIEIDDVEPPTWFVNYSNNQVLWFSLYKKMRTIIER